MRVLIDGKPATLDTRRVLGEGGEASVLLHGSRNNQCAVKLYKQPPASADKLRALAAIAPGLDTIATLPRALVSDPRTGVVLGFTMALCQPGFEPLALLAKLSVRAQLGIDLARLLSLFSTFHAELEAIHLAGAVVGDLNDQNELFDPAGAVRFIDADSFQVGGFPCEVVTEAYLDPLLYGPDITRPCATRDGKPRWFGRGSDWYAFAAILFRSLTGVHPFGGSTATPRSLPERASRRESALGGGITLPRHLRARVAALPENLLGALAGIFEAGDRRPLPSALLQAAQRGARVCSCGLELAGGVRVCPGCTASRAASGSKLEVVELSRADGVFLALSTLERDWFALAREASGYALLSGRFGDREARRLPLACGERVFAAMSGKFLALAELGPSAKLKVLDAARGTTSLDTATEVAFGRPAFTLAGDMLYRIARGSLMATHLESGREVERLAVVSEQTLLHARPGGAFAVTAVLGQRHYIAVDERKAIDLEVEPLARGERLLAESIVGDGSRTLLLRHIATAGVDWVLTSLLDANGKSVREGRMPAAARAAGVAIHGGLFAKGAYLVATDGGLVREDVTAPSTSVTFPETSPFVSLDSELTASAFGLVAKLGRSLYVLSQKP